MNGLEETYQGQVEFRSLNAVSAAGQQAFRAYGLPGHPGFILLNPEGEVLWKGFGEQPAADIETQLLKALEAP